MRTLTWCHYELWDSTSSIDWMYCLIISMIQILKLKRVDLITFTSWLGHMVGKTVASSRAWNLWMRSQTNSWWHYSKLFIISWIYNFIFSTFFYLNNSKMVQFQWFIYIGISAIVFPSSLKSYGVWMNTVISWFSSQPP